MPVIRYFNETTSPAPELTTTPAAVVGTKKDTGCFMVNEFSLKVHYAGVKSYLLQHTLSPGRLTCSFRHRVHAVSCHLLYVTHLQPGVMGEIKLFIILFCPRLWLQHPSQQHTGILMVVSSSRRRHQSVFCQNGGMRELLFLI